MWHHTEKLAFYLSADSEGMGLPFVQHIDGTLRLLNPGDSFGSDFAGDIVEIGPDAQDKVRYWLRILSYLC